MGFRLARPAEAATGTVWRVVSFPGRIVGCQQWGQWGLED